MKYTFFWKGPLSNWYPSKFNYKGHTFNNSEQAFMWEKASVFKDYETAKKILNSTSPKEAKDLGRQVKGFDNKIWEEVRYEYMFDVCVQKFIQNEDLKKQLLASDNYVEASPYDTIWGIGMSENQPGIENSNNWKGLNLLGKVLNEVRNSIILYENENIIGFTKLNLY